MLFIKNRKSTKSGDFGNLVNFLTILYKRCFEAFFVDFGNFRMRHNKPISCVIKAISNYFGKKKHPPKLGGFFLLS